MLDRVVAVDDRDDDLVGTVIVSPPVADGAAPEDHAPDEAGLRPGDRVGPYQLVERLGAGGMGVVWVARDPRLARTVAVKVLHEQRRRSAEQARERLRREALALARLSHPNVVAIYDVGVHERRVFLTMEHVEGRTLDVWAAQAPSLASVLEVFEQVAAGLHAVHCAGFVHRDLKPTNVMIARDGRVLVMDFGLARIQDPESVSEHEPSGSSSWRLAAPPFSMELTADGMVMGTPAYMAPEQHAGEEADARADQFAFCATLYEVLLGQRPFRGRSVQELAQQKQHARLELTGRLRLPRTVRALLVRGLDPEPARRFSSMAALRDALARLRRPTRWRGTGVAAVGVVAAAGIGWAALQEPEPAPCEAGAAHMAAVWSDDTRAELEHAFVVTGLPYAKDVAQRTSARLDAYTHDWAESHARACRVVGVDPGADAAFDRTMRCLGDARVSMTATVALLVRADATTVQHAVAQVAGLPTLARCGDQASLQAEVALPTEAAEAAALEAVRLRIEEAAALDRAGHYAEGRARAAEALAEALALGYEPAVVRARIRLASLDLGLGDAEGSRRGLTEAALLAAGIDDHHAAADAATRLSFVLAEEFGQPEEALRWARHAEASLARLPPDPLARARLDSSVGVILSSQGDYTAALAAFERAYATKRELLGEGHPEVVGALDNVALSHGELGRPARAEELQRRTLTLLEDALGPRHPDLAHALMNLGHSLDVLGRHDEAIAQFTRALRIFREALGTRHPMVARTLAALGHAAVAQDRLLEADAYLREAGEIIEAVHGERHREHAWSLADRARVLDRLGRKPEAAALYARAHEIVEATMGPDHDSLAHVMMGEAETLVALERLDEAEPLVARAGEILAARLEPGHPAHADWHACRAELLRARGRLEDARQALATAVSVSTGAFGPEHPAVAWFLLSLGEVEVALQRYEEARAHLRDAAAITQRTQVGEGFRASARFTLATALWPDPATRPEAIGLARAAEAGFARLGDAFEGDLEEVTAWLRDHPP